MIMTRKGLVLREVPLPLLDAEIRRVEENDADPLKNPAHWRLAQKYLKRLRAIKLLLEGKPRREVMRTLGIGRSSLYRWVCLWNAGGFELLSPVPHTGRYPKVGREGLRMLDQDLQKPPTVFGFREDAWSTRLIMIHIAAKYGVRYHVSSIYKLMQRLDYNLRTPYPEDPRGNPKEAAFFKEKVLPALIKKEEVGGKG